MFLPLKPTVRIVLLVKQIMKLGRNFSKANYHLMSSVIFGSKTKFDPLGLLWWPKSSQDFEKQIRPVFCQLLPGRTTKQPGYPDTIWNRRKSLVLEQTDLNLNPSATTYELTISETQFSHLQVGDCTYQKRWRNGSQMLFPKPVLVFKKVFANL